MGFAFDGSYMWAVSFDGYVYEIALNGSLQGTYAVATHGYRIAFDGANMWVVGNGDPGDVIELSSTGATLTSDHRQHTVVRGDCVRRHAHVDRRRQRLRAVERRGAEAALRRTDMETATVVPTRNERAASIRRSPP